MKNSANKTTHTILLKRVCLEVTHNKSKLIDNEKPKALINSAFAKWPGSNDAGMLIKRVENTTNSRFFKLIDRIIIRIGSTILSLPSRHGRGSYIRWPRRCASTGRFLSRRGRQWFSPPLKSYCTHVRRVSAVPWLSVIG